MHKLPDTFYYAKIYLVTSTSRHLHLLKPNFWLRPLPGHCKIWPVKTVLQSFVHRWCEPASRTDCIRSNHCNLLFFGSTCMWKFIYLLSTSLFWWIKVV